jgi:putative protein-disulfide isomerase
MPTLYFVHDPMCSWCYAFAPTWRRIEAALPESIAVEYVLGGLAPDSDQPMPASMQSYIQETWRRIQRVVPGTVFNYAFWTDCAPRRSTYPACRAVLAAKRFDPGREKTMIDRIQSAYYREARNPADVDTLCVLADEIGIDPLAFRERITSKECQAMLERDLVKTRSLRVTGFPSLVLEAAHTRAALPIDYNDPQATLSAIEPLIPA